MIRAGAACAAAWALSAAFSAGLTLSGARPAAETRGGLLGRVIGGAAEGVGDLFLREADKYYHGGVEERFEHEPAPLGAENDHAEELGGLHEDAPRGDWAAWVNRRVRSYEHRHVSGVEQKELLPFFYFATRLNPRNLEAALTTAYWLDRRLQRPDQAARVLEESLRVNPGAWQLHAALGELLLRRGTDARLAERHLSRALDLERGRATGHERVELWARLGMCRRVLGEREAGTEALRRARAELAAVDPAAAFLTELDRLIGPDA